MKTKAKTNSERAAGATRNVMGEPPTVTDVPTATALKLYVVLARTVAAIERHAFASIESSGLTTAEFGVLEALYHRGPLLLGEVQRKILVSSGGITFLVDRLEKRGLVERLPCETDRRARYAALTDAGSELISGIFPRHAEAIRRSMSGLGLADQRAAVALMRTLGTEAAALALAKGDPQGP